MARNGRPHIDGNGGPTDRKSACGHVVLISGCMFSGKTTELLRRLSDCADGEVLAVKPAIDTRYDDSDIVTHDGLHLAARAVTHSSQMTDLLTPATRVVGIDEAHFFDAQLPDVVADLKRRGLTVILTSLQPDSWGRPFEMNDRLAALADEVVACSARCARCAAPADRTQRLTPIVGDNMVGGSECYEPRCRNCWHPPRDARPSAAILAPVGNPSKLPCS